MPKAKTGIAVAPKINAPGPRRGGVGGVGGHALGKIKPTAMPGLTGHTGSTSVQSVPGLTEAPGKLHNGWGLGPRRHERTSRRQSDPARHRLISSTKG
jgi:hypothetical protein